MYSKYRNLPKISPPFLNEVVAKGDYRITACKQLIACEVGEFSREISQLSKIRPPPSLHEEPLKFIAHERIFER